MPHLRTIHGAIVKVFASALHAFLIFGLAAAQVGYQAVIGVAAAHSQEPSTATGGAPTDFETLVGPVALYPDELLGIVLPASTYPLQIVQASRYLEKKKTESELEPDEEWDESIIGLLNYPEVIDLMNEDLDWTWELGAAVSDHEGKVMDAVQSFRKKVDEAGNLESNDKLKITKEDPEPQEGESVAAGDPAQQVIVIESASPEVIYVPQYQPSTVVIYQTTPYPYYYSPPYPYYYHPHAAFWTGMFVGAAIGYGLRWGHHHQHGGIHVNRNVNINVNKTNINVNNRKNNLNSGGGSWKGDKSKRAQAGGRPGNKNAGSRPSSGQRDRASAGTGRSKASASNRASTGASTGKGAGKRAGAGGQTRTTNKASSGASKSRDRTSSRGRDMTSPRSGRDGSRHGNAGQRSSRGSFGDYGSGSGSAARSNSSRGQSSRSGASRGGGRGGGGGGGGGGRRR